MNIAPASTLARLQSIKTTSLVLTGALVSAGLLLAGCQSTALSQANIATNNTPSAAKTALATALQQQRRQSFSYHSNVEISNEAQFSAGNTTPAAIQPLAKTGYIDDYCEDTHDQAYADLLVQAQAQQLDISTSAYETQRQALKQNYLACNEAYLAWDANQYPEDDSSYGDYSDEGESTAYSIDSRDAAVALKAGAKLNSETSGAAGATIVETSRIKGAKNQVTSSSSTIAAASASRGAVVSPYYQQLFDNYEDMASVTDNKKAQLLDAYLLKPLSINAQGVYQPLAGRFTMLGSVQYQGRNNQTSMNQPVYIDFKGGNIYLWADNFALFNSELLDNKLGTKWQNKWLKLALDDGSLPKGFGSAVIKAHLKALDNNYANADASQFDFIAPNSLTALSPKLSTQQLIPMLQSAQIIRRTRSLDSYKQSYSDYAESFYHDITQQYPQLITPSQDDELSNASAEDQTFTSKVLVEQLLALMKKASNEPEQQQPVESETLVSLPIQDLYGLDNRGQLQWHHNRSYAPVDSQAKLGSQISTDILQRYLPLRGQEPMFPNLPADAQLPNASNSVDIRQYSTELADYYRNGGGTTIGKMLFSALPMYKSIYATKAEGLNAE